MGIRAARWHGGFDFRAGPHPARPRPGLPWRCRAGLELGEVSALLPARLLATCKQRLSKQRGSRGYRAACPANEAGRARGSSPLVAGSD